MNCPKELKYTRTHEWVRFTDEKTAYIGITDFAQDQLGDLVFVNLPEAGDTVTAGETFADVESVKAVSDVNSPVTGEVAAVNEDLADEPPRMGTRSTCVSLPKAYVRMTDRTFGSTLSETRIRLRFFSLHISQASAAAQAPS